MATEQPLDRLPDELLLSIASHLPPAEALAFSLTNERHNRIVGESLRWRQRCLSGWRYGPAPNYRPNLAAQNPLSVSWQKLFETRQSTDQKAETIFEDLLQTQRGRIRKMEQVGALGYDVKDQLLQWRDETPDDADDVLARRFYARAILDVIHRTIAIDLWARLAKHDLKVTLIEALGAYDLFVLNGKWGDLETIQREINRIADGILNEYGQRNWGQIPQKGKALIIAGMLREKNLLGNPDATAYHDLRNNFLSMALFVPPHTSLPLQSVAIYCAVAQRLGVNAQPSNYPGHVYAVVDCPRGASYDPRLSDDLNDHIPQLSAGNPHTSEQRMYLDPFNSAHEIVAADLSRNLRDQRVPAGRVAALMGPTSVAEATRRAGRNILRSAQSGFHDHDEDEENEGGEVGNSVGGGPLAYETATYVGLWNAVLLGDGQVRTRDHALQQSRLYLAPLLERLLQHFPQEICLAEKLCATLFPRASDGDSSLDNSGDEGGNQEQDPMDPRNELAAFREADDQPRTPKIRSTVAGDGASSGLPVVEYRVGQYFKHRRYKYLGVVIGWDETCKMPEAWIQQMRVDELDKGRDQPFYHIIDTNRNARYVAQENIMKLARKPRGDILTKIAGRYFKRWDAETQVFVSNLKEEYPED
ncbi:YccV-like-domain-containing protein [Apiospora saccharicola]|uniref:YccV-like-domain-containing protein n=1 Tax=Apiospora saccharicola TaxID=335842 RepID=A0ABR1VEJ0_9PEZI